MSGKIIIFSAPSGAGKTTLVRHLLESDLPLAFSISATNREPRQNEKDGADYYFIGTPEFMKRIDDGDFLEWEEVYEGQYYGTLKSEVSRIWALGKSVIFDVDVKGGITIKSKYPEKSLAVFVMPPSTEILEARLRKRQTESAESLKKRIEKAHYEISFKNEYDEILKNDDLEISKAESYYCVKAFLDK